MAGINALGKLKWTAKTASPYLIHLLGDPNLKIRSAASAALKNIGTAKGIDAVKKYEKGKIEIRSSTLSTIATYSTKQKEKQKEKKATERLELLNKEKLKILNKEKQDLQTLYNEMQKAKHYTEKKKMVAFSAFTEERQKLANGDPEALERYRAEQEAGMALREAYKEQASDYYSKYKALQYKLIDRWPAENNKTEEKYDKARVKKLKEKYMKAAMPEKIQDESREKPIRMY